VNLSVRAAALYAVRGFMAGLAPPLAPAAWEAPALDPALLTAFLLIFAQLALVTAVALFFSTFSTPLLSAALTFGLYIIGHFNADLKNFEAVVDSPVAAWTARVLYYLLPNLAPFDVKAQVVHGQAIDGGSVVLTLGYAVLYIAALLVAAVLVFERRDLK
jgi:ABC-type transport system involved in multi-copper enzyme maturation permease subunit